MSLLFSRQCEYALQAILFLATKPPKEMVPAKELAEKLNIPYHFLAKIFQDLSRKGILVSLKGPTGGFTLGKAAKEITLFHIIEAIDGANFMENCVLGFSQCGGENPCAVHNKWGDLRDEIHRMLTSKNIMQLSKEMKKPVFQE
ncbi:MAG: Rrf2 family transcriptional regulator [Ignavibacteria bacterium]|nr:Rrf2 family transcriptional regulator [Ignavibacteria bacterium]